MEFWPQIISEQNFLPITLLKKELPKAVKLSLGYEKKPWLCPVDTDPRSLWRAYGWSGIEGPNWSPSFCLQSLSQGHKTSVILPVLPAALRTKTGTQGKVLPSLLPQPWLPQDIKSLWGQGKGTNKVSQSKQLNREKGGRKRGEGKGGSYKK